MADKTDASAPSSVVPLWTSQAPGALGADSDQDVPTLSIYRPAASLATGAAMIICPGGGYGMLAAHEGRDFALFLNGLGIVGLVLKYRLGPRYKHPAMIRDAQRAIRLARHHAADWRIDVNRVGMMGSSAGGHLTSTAMVHFGAADVSTGDLIDEQNARPDLGVLCYPVISMGTHTNPGSRKNLLGDTPSEDMLTLLSNEQHVTPDTPPCFLWHTADDGAVDVRHSLDFASALARHKVPFDLHVYQNGRHGLGLGVKGYDPAKTPAGDLLPWSVELARWLTLHGFAI